MKKRLAANQGSVPGILSRNMAMAGAIPLRDFGKTGVKTPALGMDGHHLGEAKDEIAAVTMRANAKFCR
jgi:hypothetical protein